MKRSTHVAAFWALVVIATGCGGKDEEPSITHPPSDASGDTGEDGRTPDVTDASDGSDGCRSGTRLMYKRPGCGTNAPVRECVSTAMDPVACSYCDCNGVTQRGEGCNQSPISVPFAAWGSCADAEAGPPDVSDASDANDAKGDADASDAILDAPVCPTNAVLAYNQPGCGANAPAPYCQGPTDACLTFVCDCNGATTGSGCGFSTVPFASWGACPDAAPRDASDVSDASDSGDAKNDADEGDVTDAPCPPWSVVAYNQPGCGINTPPSYCQGPTDSCLAPVCDCNGVTNWSVCGYAQVPFAAWGACPDSGVTDAIGD